MIYHVCRKEDFEKEKDDGLFGSAELGTYGFIHSSTKEGLKKILPRFEKTEELVVLYIDEDELKEKIRYEDKDQQHLYPHFYEPIDASSIKEIKTLNEWVKEMDL